MTCLAHGIWETGEPGRLHQHAKPSQLGQLPPRPTAPLLWPRDTSVAPHKRTEPPSTSQTSSAWSFGAEHGDGRDPGHRHMTCSSMGYMAVDHGRRHTLSGFGRSVDGRLAHRCKKNPSTSPAKSSAFEESWCAFEETYSPKPQLSPPGLVKRVPPWSTSGSNAQVPANYPMSVWLPGELTEAAEISGDA